MQLTPRYDGPPPLILEGAESTVVELAVRQRRRLDALVSGLDASQWSRPTRCAAWTVGDVVAHLVGVQAFWSRSLAEGVAGRPTRYLATFDPVATPAALVEGARRTGADQQATTEQLLAVDATFLEQLLALTPEQLALPCETPAGHVAAAVLVQHVFWDSWVHERDIALPLGLEAPVHDDEVVSALSFSLALGASVVLEGGGEVPRGRFAVVTTEPSAAFHLVVADEVRIVPDEVHIAPDDVPTTEHAEEPLLTGPALQLAEAASVRGPLPNQLPVEGRRLLTALATAFDQPF